MATIEQYALASGAKLWQVRYRTPDRRQTSKRGFRTKRDAEAWLSENEVRKARGEYVAPALGRIAVGELGPDWLNRKKGIVKPSSFHSLESAWDVHVEPRWGRVRLCDIAPSDVQGWASELAVKRKATVVRTAHSVLSGILNDAVRDRRIGVNPAAGVKLPARARRKNTYLTAVQLGALAAESGRYRSLVLLLGTAGMRWGEAAALRVRDVDFLRRRIVLHENAVTVGADVHVGTLKSGKSRTVPLAEFVVRELAVTCEARGHDDLIWPARDGGHLSSPSSHDSWLSGAVARCRKADETFPRVTAHDLRHTAASLAVSAGANVKVVQRMLGHASAAMTLDRYADLFDDDLTAVADKLDESVGKMWARRLDSAVRETSK